MGIMPRPGAGAGIDLAGQRLPNRWELEFDPVVAQVPEPEPEKELPDAAAEALDCAASPELQSYLAANDGSTPGAAAQASPEPASSGSPAVSFDPAAVAKAKASLDTVPEPGQQEIAIVIAAQATSANSKTGGTGRIAHGRRRGSPTRHHSTKPGGGGSYGVITGAVHQSRGVHRQALQDQTGRRPLGNEARSGYYKDRRAAHFGGQGGRGSAWAAQTGVDRFGRPKTIRAKVEEELLAGPNALSPTRLSPTRRGKAPAASSAASTAKTGPALQGAVPPVVVHKA